MVQSGSNQHQKGPIRTQLGPKIKIQSGPKINIHHSTRWYIQRIHLWWNTRSISHWKTGQFWSILGQFWSKLVNSGQFRNKPARRCKQVELLKAASASCRQYVARRPSALETDRTPKHTSINTSAQKNS